MIQSPIVSDALNYEEIISRINDIYNSCSVLEQQQFIRILEELSDKGYSQTLEQIYLVDFKEVPVSIDRFLTDPYYLGETNDCGKQIYPGWWDVYHDVFNPQRDIYEVILSGATRIGKTSTAVSMMCYMTYLLMCYRNPQKYFGLKEVSRATIAFANLTKELATAVAHREYHDTLIKSPWFMEHGTKNNSTTKPVYIPEGNQIEIVAASDSAHLLGMQLWCLVGDTKIVTTSGYCTLSEACDTEQSIMQIDTFGNIVTCKATIKLTKYVNETIKVVLNDGSSIEGTPEHQILLANGKYKQLGDLSISDVLLTRCTSYCGIYKDTQICKIKKHVYSESIPVYDVINAGDYHNFMVLAGQSILIAHNCCIFDEVNFVRAGIKDISISKTHMQGMYNTANARITGTFKLNGRIYGKMFTCSSKNTDNDYLSDHIEEQLNAGNKHMYLFDKPQWEVLPSYRFGEGKFHITVGDRYKRGFVIPQENDDENHLETYRQEGYKVLEVPLDYLPNFRADYDVALRDIAGISVVGAMGFITQELITPNISEDRKNPFYEDYIEIGGHDNDTIERHFHIDAVPKHIKGLQLYMHLDLAEVSDHIGICGVVQDGMKNVVDIHTEKKISMPFIKEVFQVSIGAPRGDRMSFQKVINFILWLKQQGFWIQLVTTDQYQGSYVRESLNNQGIPSDLLSVDRNMDAYNTLRNLLYDQRLELIKCDLQEVEMINLQRQGDKIDHKPQSACFTGDTKIQLVDGRSLTIEELLIEQSYRTNWVYTVNESTGLIEPKPILDVFQTKLTKDLVKVTLDNNEVIYCTPDHRFMLRDGSYEIAENLSSGDSLMPLYTKLSQKGLSGYRMYYEPMEDKWHFEHRQFCYGNSSKEKNIVHHCNYNKLDNTPTNLQRVSKSEHRRIHNNSTVNYTQTAKSLCDWYINNKDTEEYKLRRHKGSITTIINNHYRKTGERLSIAEAESISNKNAVAEKILNQRIHDIELLFNVDWTKLSGRQHVAYGCKLSSVINKIEHSYSVIWNKLSDDDKNNYYYTYISDKLLLSLERAISTSLNQTLSKYNNKNNSTTKISHIRTMSTFGVDEIRIQWIEYLFGVDWSELSSNERSLATRRFNRLLNSGEYIPLDVKIKYIPKPQHIIKSLDLFGSDMDIKFKNIEELYGLHMEDIPRNQHSGYCRKYNNFCKGKVNKKLAAAKALQCRIAEIERIYGVSWEDLDTADKSKYSLKYHNLMNPDDKKSHYTATSTAISQCSWYTNGMDNKYIKHDEDIPEGYYKGRTISSETRQRIKEAAHNRTDEEKVRISKLQSDDASRRIWVTNGTIDKYIYKDTPIPEGFTPGRCRLGKNHKVVSVERIVKPCRVYDLTIADNHNFALSAGVFVHNSKSAVPSLDNGYNSKGIGKDASDSLAGACFSLVKNLDEVKPPAKNVLGAIASVNGKPNIRPNITRPSTSYGINTGNRPNNFPGFGQQYRKF